MNCSLCHSDATQLLLDLGKQPLANKYPFKEQFATEDFFPLQVFFCTNCKNVQLGTFISRERMFEDYYYLSSVNLGLVRHFEEWAKQLTDAKFVLDVGSNDGILLKPLKELGVKAIGLDPSINVGKIANDQGLTTIVSFFDAQAVEKVKNEYGMPDVVIASSIFTHVGDPHTFLDDINTVMAPGGSFIIEVEYIANIIRDIQFERFYLDRIFYYSLSSLKNLFASHGLRLTDVELIEPHGGSLRVTAHRENEGPKTTERVHELLKEEEKTLSQESLQTFKKTVESHMAAFKEKLEEHKKSGLKVAGYGSPARVATISNYGKIDSSLVEFIIDDSPLKQNKFSPGMHIPIFPRDYLETNKPDILVVFAHEYLNDIRKKTEGGGYRYLLPIPPREV